MTALQDTEDFTAGFADDVHPRAGEKIVTNFWRKPGPTNKFDWSATARLSKKQSTTS